MKYRIVRPTQDRFQVTINQPTNQSYETASLSVDPETAQQPVIVSYSQLQGSRARVRLALTFPGQTSITASVGQFEGKIVDPFTHRAVDSCALTADADKKFRFVVEVDAEQDRSKAGRSLPVLRDMISLNLTSPGGQNKSFDIPLPLTPSISKIEAASGHYAFEQDVVIRGTNLQNVAKVFFGTRQADLLFQAERNSITVRVPSGAEVPNGGKVRVPVRLDKSQRQREKGFKHRRPFFAVKSILRLHGGPSTKLNGKQESGAARRIRPAKVRSQSQNRDGALTFRRRKIAADFDSQCGSQAVELICAMQLRSDQFRLRLGRSSAATSAAQVSPTSRKVRGLCRFRLNAGRVPPNSCSVALVISCLR